MVKQQNRIILALAAVGALALCTITASAAGKPPLDTPTISCADSTAASIDVQVCAGASGAPAGFTVQWLTSDDYAANGGTFEGASGNPNIHYCDASFSGNAKDSRYVLAAGQCVTVRIGELLMDNGASTSCPEALTECTTYYFRVFAHASGGSGRSAFSAAINCTTLCLDQCDPAVLSQGYWKQHTPLVCDTDPGSPLCIQWPVSSLTLGTVNYDVAQLVSILNTNPGGKGGANGLISLAHQVIATKLNIANGASQDYIDETAVDLLAADILIGNLVIPPVGSGFLSPSLTDSLTSSLDGAISNFECQDSE